MMRNGILRNEANPRRSRSRCALTLLALPALLSLASCTAARWHEVAPHTGEAFTEKQTTDTRAEDLAAGDRKRVNPDRLRARTEPDQPSEEVPYVLERGDEVEVVDPTPKGEHGLIEVEVIDTAQPEKPRRRVFVPPQYIADKPRARTPEEREADRYFMIQNVATQKVRVYERCEGSNCSHKLILETDMTAGEDTPDKTRRTLLGSYRISAWFKFYEDHANLYLSWYHPKYPPLPPPGASLAEWASKALLPPGKGRSRGKFGWYTAHLAPNADAQWTHGTLGWGADGGRFIRLSPEEFSVLDEDRGSAGCTRVENQAIAFIREILPVGSQIIKIYAKESYRDAELARYKDLPEARWNWILTKEGVDIDGPKSGREGVLKRGVSSDQILETGTYTLDQLPNASAGNLYAIQDSSFKGVFLVDEGKLVGYEHPRGLRIGGHADRRLPSFLQSTQWPEDRSPKRVTQHSHPND